MPAPNSPIGVFDSGVGGLTVLKELRRALPGRRMIYLGDTARLPYGAKSPETIRRYALQAGKLLVGRGAGRLVVACNTASAHGLGPLREAFPSVPVHGVIEPGAAAAVAASQSGRIAVIATEATVRAGAYETAIRALLPGAEIQSLACPIFVALAEEGWGETEIAEAAARRYLSPLLQGDRPDVVILGCTHFPALKAAIARVLGPGVRLVDSAEAVALSLAAGADVGGAAGSVSFLATDNVERFARVAGHFLPEPIAPGEVELVELG